MASDDEIMRSIPPALYSALVTEVTLYAASLIDLQTNTLKVPPGALVAAIIRPVMLGVLKARLSPTWPKALPVAPRQDGEPGGEIDTKG